MLYSELKDFHLLSFHKLQLADKCNQIKIDSKHGRSYMSSWGHLVPLKVHWGVEMSTNWIIEYDLIMNYTNINLTPNPFKFCCVYQNYEYYELLISRIRVFSSGWKKKYKYYIVSGMHEDREWHSGQENFYTNIWHINGKFWCLKGRKSHTFSYF